MLVVTVVLTLSTSCSRDESSITDKLQQYVANDVDFIFAGNLERVLEVTGSTQKSGGAVELSDYMQKLVASLPTDVRNNVNDVLDAEGFDWTSAVSAIRLNSRGFQTLTVWSVKDEGDFADYFVEKYGYHKEKTDGFIMLYDNDVNIALRDRLAFIATSNGQVMSKAETINTIIEWQHAAKSKPVAKWKCSYLDNGDVVSAMVNLDNVAKLVQERIDDADFYQQTRPEVLMLSKVLPSARKLIVGMTFNVEGRKATLNGKFFTSGGEQYKTNRLDGDFNASLLKFVTPKDMAVVGVSDASVITTMLGHSVTGLGSEIIGKWLDNFAGSMMIATGLKTDDLEVLVKSPASDMHWVLAADCKAGKASAALNAFATLLPFADDATVTKHSADELRFRVPTSYTESATLEPWEDGYYRPVYTNFIMKVEGDVLLLSNDEIDPTPVADFTADMFKNKSVVAVVHAAKNNTLMKAINAPFGAELRVSIDSSEFEVQFMLDSTNKNLIEALVGFAGPALNR